MLRLQRDSIDVFSPKGDGVMLHLWRRFQAIETGAVHSL